jgi:hypothetical protein
MELNSTVQYPEGVVVEEKSKTTSENRPPDDNRQSADMATIYDDDERLLARIGYRQVSSLLGQGSSFLISRILGT